MKKIFIAILMLCASSAFAGVVTIHEAPVPQLNPFTTIIDKHFGVDAAANQGTLKVAVYKLFALPGQFRTSKVLVYKAKVNVVGLVLVGDKFIFHAPEGEVECGIYKPGTIFRKAVLKLNGKCKLKSLIDGDENDTKIIINLKTI